VSFVSVTQSFNTTSSMGRLTLNVLLSFAQFEREVTGERVRDKIAASKRKGIWVGGPVPLGYRSVDKKLEIVPEEADLVRTIFESYLRLGSISALAASLNAEGLKPKPRRLANGRTVAAACYCVGPLAHLLKNRFYIGEVAYRGEIHAGEHEPILDRALFDAVQSRLKEQAVERSAIRSSTPALLAGRIFDDRKNPMTPTHANKKGIRYRYYVSHALLQGRANEAGSVARISAPDVEALIANRLRAESDADNDASDREIIENHLVRAIVGRDQITIAPRIDASMDGANDQSDGRCERSERWSDDLGPLQGDAARAQGNLVFAIAAPDDRRSHAIGAADVDRTLKSVGRHDRQRSCGHQDDCQTRELGRATRSVLGPARLSLAARH
jgi:site-specific DNA recombinase